MARQDLLLDDDKNLLCDAGDFSAGDSDAQHVDLLIASTKGMFKESPVLGSGLIHYLKKPDGSIREMKREINVQLATDGYKLTAMELDASGDYKIEYQNNY